MLRQRVGSTVMAREKAKGRLEQLQHAARAGMQLYTPIKLPLSRDIHLQAMAVGLEATNAILSSLFFTDPMLPLAAMLAIFKATLDSPLVAPKNKACRSLRQATTWLRGLLP